MKTKFIVNEPYVVCIGVDRKLGRKFKGKAKCQPDDVFDVEKGKEIAQLKMEINRELCRINRTGSEIRYIENQTKKIVDNLYNRILIYNEKLDNKYTQLYELLKTT